MSSDHFSATTLTTSMNLFILLLLLSLNFSFFFLKVHAQEPNDLIFKSASSSSANLKATSQHSNGSQPLSSSSSSGRPSPKTVLNISSQLSAGQCPPEFEGRCLCGMGAFAQSRPTYITNCTNAGFGVGKANKSGQTISPSHYLQAIDNRTEVLIFTGNHFPELPANLLLLNRSYDQLHTVDLSNNNISTIHGKAFHNMRSVRVLYLNDNRLRITGAAAAQADLTNKPKPKPAKVHHHHHGGRRVNPMAIIIGDRGDGSVGGSSVQDGVDMCFNSEDDDDDNDDDQSEPDEIAPTTSAILERQSPHPRMFSPLRSLEQLHLRNAFEMRERTSSQHGKKKALFAADSDDGAIKNDKASLALVAALGEVFRKSNVSTLKLLNLEANGLTSFERTFSSSSSSSSSLSSSSSSSFFCALPRLQHLQLAYNRLSGYPVNGSCLRWLSTVDLTGNQIQTMDARSMALIRSSGPALGALHFNFARNPFRCDCALLPFFRFLTAANSETADPRQSPKFEALPEYRCYLHSSKGGGGSGNDIVGQYFDDLNEADFGDCGSSSKSLLGVSSLKTENGGGLIKEGSQLQNEKSEAIRRYRHYITLSYIVLAILLLLLAFLLAVLAYTNRTWILSTWNYFLLEMNYPKSDYTALDAKGDNGGGGGSSRGDEDDGDGDQIEQDLDNCQPTGSANNLDETVTAVNGNKANGLQQKKGSNKGKSSKKFGNRQSSGSNSAANRSNHIRMRELKNGHDASVAEEQV